jgi:hypothetical protein
MDTNRKREQENGEAVRPAHAATHAALLQEGETDFVVAAEACHPTELVDENDRAPRRDAG